MHYVCGLFLIESVTVGIEGVGEHREFRENYTVSAVLLPVKRTIQMDVFARISSVLTRPPSESVEKSQQGSGAAFTQFPPNILHYSPHSVVVEVVILQFSTTTLVVFFHVGRHQTDVRGFVDESVPVP